MAFLLSASPVATTAQVAQLQSSMVALEGRIAEQFRVTTNVLLAIGNRLVWLSYPLPLHVHSMSTSCPLHVHQLALSCCSGHVEPRRLAVGAAPRWAPHAHIRGSRTRVYAPSAGGGPVTGIRGCAGCGGACSAARTSAAHRHRAVPQQQQQQQQQQQRHPLFVQLARMCAAALRRYIVCWI